MSDSQKTRITIQAGQTDTRYWKDLWLYRELFYFLSWRDLVVRYKQTAIGIAWAILRPLLTMIVFTIVFSKFAKLPSDGIPYPILVLAALLPWQFFSNAFTEASNSLVNDSQIISKVYFPRLIIPASSIVVSFVDFTISFLLLVAMMIWYQVIPDWRIVFLPLFILLTCFISLGAGLWVAALNVKYRDFRYVVPFIVQIGLYISPVGYSSSVVPDKLRVIFSLNPMTGIIDGFRWSLSGGKIYYHTHSIVFSVIAAILLCVLGFYYFRKSENTFADII